MGWHSGKPADNDFLSASVQHIRENFAELEPLQPHVDALLSSRIVDHNLDVSSPPNGWYVRWENGLQVCLANSGNVTRTVDTALNNWYRSPSNLSWTYPAAFIRIPAAGVFIARGGTLYAWALNRLVSETSLEYMIISSASADQSVMGSFIAIGRWK